MKHKGYYDEEQKRKQEKLNSRQCMNVNNKPKLVFTTELEAQRYVKALFVLKNVVVHHYFCGYHKGYHVGHNYKDLQKEKQLIQGIDNISK